MNGEQLKQMIEGAENTVAPSQIKVDWGNSKGKNAMADAPVGIKTYVDEAGGLELSREQNLCYRELTRLGQSRYLKARSIGFDHNAAMIVGYVGSAGVDWAFAAKRIKYWGNQTNKLEAV